MDMLAFAAFQLPQINPPHDFTPFLQLLLRWVHFAAGITWVGLLYFFNLVNAPFLKEIDPGTRTKVVPLLMPRALWWFRWSSVVTVFAGIWYWMLIVSADAHNAQTSGGHAIGTFFGLWTLAFIAEMAMLMGPLQVLRKGAVFGVLVGVLVAAAAWLYLALNAHGWESNRLLAIGIGGGLGWFMMLNVWGIIWRAQKRLIRWTQDAAAGTPMPAEAPRLAQLAQIVSRTNFVLSFPMLLFMAIASHYPVFGR